MSFQRLEIRDNQETVKRKIRQASASMFVREFTQNAIEAARAAGANARVKWWQFTEGDTRKLSIWNNGRGMTAEELSRVMHLFASGAEKTQSADGNFGIGAKITGLAASPLGVLWRSCKNGLVTQIYLGWRDGVPGFDDPEDVTEFYQGARLEQFDTQLYRQLGDVGLLDFEWTMAVLMGRSDQQDTVLDPLGDDKPVGGKGYWLFKGINRRFFDFGCCNVTAIINSNGERREQGRRCKGLYHIPAEREETVEQPYGTIRYCLLPESLADKGEDTYGYTHHGALVFRNEVYDGLFAGAWVINGRRAGVIAAANRIAIQVVLSDDFAASPNEQRNLLERETDFAVRTPIRWQDFEDDVCTSMPEWLRDFINIEDAKKISGSDKLRRALRRLMVEMGLTSKSHDPGADPIAIDGGDGVVDVVEIKVPTPRGGLGNVPDRPETGESAKPRPRTPRPPFRRGPAVKTGAQKNLNSEPTVQWVKEAESTLVGFYDSKNHNIQLNESYPLLKSVVDKVISGGVPEAFRDRVIAEAREQINIAAATHVLWALAHVSKNEWEPKQAEKALTPESLTASIGFSSRHLAVVEAQCRHFKSGR